MPAQSRAGWGWHRLTETWADEIVAAAGVRRGELVLDIGAGTGALTRALCDAGAHVIAVELHPERVATLRERFADKRVTVVRTDAAALRLPRRAFRVVANPPFGITSALLRRLLAPGTRLTGADIVVQHAVARRWATGHAPGAGRWARDYGVGMGMRLPRSAFRPPPRVDSTVLVVRRRESRR